MVPAGEIDLKSVFWKAAVGDGGVHVGRLFDA